jgi:ATP-dependent helicase HepA
MTKLKEDATESAEVSVPAAIERCRRLFSGRGVFVGIRSEAGGSGVVGKLVNSSTETALVEFFDAPTSQPRTEEFAAAALEPVTLPEQTRLYHFNEAVQAWEVGRLLDDHGTSQLVRFPNGQTRHLPVSDVFVRSGAPIDDPTAFLAAKITETPRFADARSAFVRSVVAQRAASMGMSALLSSAIELEAHQVEVVRRVLQDPIQRYLLADEVGLGKTVEAGVLIRQCFLDGGPDTQVVVLAPASLVPQWRAELSTKFFLRERLDSSLHVLSLSEERQVLRRLATATMLVIDEAHHLRREADASNVALFDRVAAAAAMLDRVLLISATPALHNTRGFLDMLHLLDPQTYGLEDEAALRERIEKRQALAEIVASLTPDNALYLDFTLDQLVALFPHDGLLQDQVEKLRTLSDAMPAEIDPEFVEALGKVRAHLSEVYRLHRRILRHRRRSVGGLTPERAGAQVIDYGSAETADLVGELEAWRVEDLASAGANNPAELQRCEKIFRERLSRHFEHPWVRERAPLSGGDRGSRIAARLGTPEAFQARLAALVEALGPLLGARRQFIVFCSDIATADHLAQGLAQALGVSVDRHSPDDMGWEAFSADMTRPILVCDRRAEEGLNLQGGRKSVVHWDLPLDPNRIEQRLGRADRYGSGDAVKSLVLRCTSDPYEAAWIDYLNKGLRVFSRSVASLQYLIDDTLRGLGPAVLEGGAEAFADLAHTSAGADGLIEREILNLDQQDALDALGTPSSDFVDALSEVDEDWRTSGRDAAGWIETTLLFQRARERLDPAGDGTETPFRYSYSTEQRHTLVPLEAFFAHCREAIDTAPTSHRTRSVQTYPLAYRRRTALSRHGRGLQTHLLRYGDPFLSGIYDIAQTDDRGRSTAMWRYMPDYKGGSIADVFFRFDFIVQSDTAGALDVLGAAERLTPAATAAILRRGDMALAPSFHTLWLDGELRQVDDPGLLARLAEAYRPEASDQGGRDYNLNAQRWRNLARLDVPALAYWTELCRAARCSAESWLRRLPSLTHRLEAAARDTATADYGRLAQLRTRAKRTGDASEEAEWRIEQDLSQVLLTGIRQPIVRLDGVLAAFLSADARAIPVVNARP